MFEPIKKVFDYCTFNINPIIIIISTYCNAIYYI